MSTKLRFPIVDARLGSPEQFAVAALGLLRSKVQKFYLAEGKETSPLDDSGKLQNPWFAQFFIVYPPHTSGLQLITFSWYELGSVTDRDSMGDPLNWHKAWTPFQRLKDLARAVSAVTGTSFYLDYAYDFAVLEEYVDGQLHAEWAPSDDLEMDTDIAGRRLKDQFGMSIEQLEEWFYEFWHVHSHNDLYAPVRRGTYDRYRDPGEMTEKQLVRALRKGTLHGPEHLVRRAQHLSEAWRAHDSGRYNVQLFRLATGDRMFGTSGHILDAPVEMSPGEWFAEQKMYTKLRGPGNAPIDWHPGTRIRQYGRRALRQPGGDRPGRHGLRLSLRVEQRRQKNACSSGNIIQKLVR